MHLLYMLLILIALNGLKYQWPKKSMFSKSLLNFKILTMVPTPYCLTAIGAKKIMEDSKRG